MMDANDIRDVFVTLQAHIHLWTEDRAHNLLPTEGSLARADALIEFALSHMPIDVRPYSLVAIGDDGRDVRVPAMAEE